MSNSDKHRSVRIDLVLAKLVLGLSMCFPATAAFPQWSDRPLRNIPSRVAVTIALVSRLPDPNAGAVILRRVNQSPNDIILMTPTSASAPQLSAAVFTLMTVREAMGNTPTENSTIRVPMREGPVMWKRTVEVSADRIVRRLRGVAPSSVPSVGMAPAVDVYLPEHALRGKLKKKGES